MIDLYKKNSDVEFSVPQHVETRAFINGSYVDSIEQKRIVKYSSVTNEKLPEICACGTADVDVAVSYAVKAFESRVWSDAHLTHRKKCMLKLADIIEAHLYELAILDCYETGRAYHNFVYDSIPKAIEAIRYFAEAVDKVYDKLVPPRGNDLGVVMREPLGVVGIITPWNDPMVVNAWKFAPALLMGNSVIVKPAEQASLSIIRVAEFVKEAGIPDGVFNVLPGYGEEVGKAIVEHKDVSGIFFTGSSEVGKKLFSYIGNSKIKKIGLECGGKSPYIITSKCKAIKEAAEVLAKNVFYNQGQICSAPSRVIVDNAVLDEFIDCIKKASNQYCPDDPYILTNEVGCVVSREQYNKVKRYIEIGNSEAKYRYEAVPPQVSNLPDNACGIVPTIFWGVSKDAVIAREEIFGPVLTVISYNDIDEAVQIANDTDYGLAGAVWTNDIDEAYFFAHSVKTGLFHINSYGEDDNAAPFGGIKNSGLGKDKSIYAFDEYSCLKTVWMRFGI